MYILNDVLHNFSSDGVLAKISDSGAPDTGLQSGVSDSDVPNNDVINNDVLNPVQPQLDNVHINAIETSLTALDNISNYSVHPRQPL